MVLREKTLKEIAPQTIDGILRADIVINILVAKLCKTSTTLVMHRIAYQQYLRETFKEPSLAAQDDSSVIDENWWAKFIDDDAIVSHGLFVSLEEYEETLTPKQKSISQDTQVDKQNSFTQDATSYLVDHQQADTRLQSSINTIDSMLQNDEIATNYPPRSSKDIGRSGIAEYLLHEQANKDLCSAKTKSHKQKKDQARLGTAAAYTLTNFREAAAIDRMEVENIGEYTLSDVAQPEFGQAAITYEATKQPKVQLMELATSKIKPVDDNKSLCTFCEYE